MTSPPPKWFAEVHDESPIPIASLPARVRSPSVFLRLRIDQASVDPWELARIEDGDLSLDWVQWWLRSASFLANAGLHCALAYIPNKRFLFRRPAFELAPLEVSELLFLLADQLHWGLPSQGGLFWSREPPTGGLQHAYDGCILPCEGASLIIANTKRHVALIL